MALTTETPAAPKQDFYLQNILERFPDYQSFTASDFNRLPDGDIRTIMGVFSNKFNPSILIPQSFVTQYGDSAPAAMMLAVERVAAARNKTELYAAASMNGGLAGAIHSSGYHYNGYIDSDVPATITLADGTVRQSTAPKILSYTIANTVMELMKQNEAARQQGTYTPQTSFQYNIPQEVTTAVFAANSNLPKEAAKLIYSDRAGDELAFMSGYATRAGASNDIGPVTMQYPASSVCVLPTYLDKIFNLNKPDIDAALAWATGYIQRDVEEMTPSQLNTIRTACPQPKSAVKR